MDTGHFQELESGQAFLNHCSGSENNHIPSRFEDMTLADLKLVRGIVNSLNLRPSQPHINRADMIHQSLGGLNRFFIIRGLNDGHIGHSAGISQVDDHLGGGAVFSYREARVGAHQLDVGVGIGHADQGLVHGASQQKTGETGGKRHLAGSCQTGRGAHHIRLADPHIKVAFGVFVPEFLGPGAVAHPGIENHDFGVRADFLQAGSVSVPCGSVFHSSSFRAF